MSCGLPGSGTSVALRIISHPSWIVTDRVRRLTALHRARSYDRAMTVRQATETDLTTIVQLSGRHRERLEALEPVFWRRNANANELQASWFGVLLADDAHQVLVSTNDTDAIEGFVIALAVDAPPVYDPGGRTCMIFEAQHRRPSE